MMLNHFEAEFLMKQKQTLVEKQAKEAWKYVRKEPNDRKALRSSFLHLFRQRNGSTLCCPAACC